MHNRLRKLSRPWLTGWLSLVLGWLILPPPAVAQGQWQPTPALSQHTLLQLAQDATGYLWLATNEGVYRYDGYQLASLTELSGGRTQLATTYHRLALGSRHDLWALSEAGLYRYSLRSGRLAAVPLPARRAPNWPVVPLGLVADTAQNRLWVLLDAYHVIGLSLDEGKLVPGDSWRFTEPIIGLTGEPTGGLWAQSQNRDLTYLQPGQPRQRYRTGGRFMYPLAGTRPQRFASISALYAARPDSTLREVRRWLSPQLPDFPETTFFLPEWQPGREQWLVGDQLVRLRRLAGGIAVGEVQVSPAQLTNAQPYSQAVYYRSFIDRLGTEWCFSPTLRGGYQRYHSAYVQPLPLASSKWYSSRAICRLPDRRLLVSTYSGLLVQPRDTPALRPLADTAAARLLRTRTFTALLPLAAGQLLAGDDGGLHLLTLPDSVPGSRLQLLRGPGVQPVLSVSTLLAGSGGRVWIGSVQGLYWLDRAHPWPHPYRPAAAVRSIRALAADRTGHLWIATTNGLYRLALASGQLQRFAYELPGTQHLPTNELLSLCAWGEQVWVGTRDQGLLLLDPKRGVARALDQRAGLPSATVCSLLADQRGSLWLGTYGGVVRYQPRSGQLAVLTAANGLADNECNYASAFQDADGALYFGSVKGVTRLDAHWRERALSPRRRLVVSRLDQLADGDSAARRRYPYPNAPLALTLHDQDAATLQFALTDYLNPATTQYQYQLRGSADSTWHSLAGTHQLRLQYLPTGNFVLRVRAEAAGGLPAANTLAIPVRARHTWWKNKWLWSGSALLLLSGAGGYAWRTYRHQRHQRLELRRRLARDLHDELGALLVRASLQAEYLQVEYPPATPLAAPLLYDLRAATQAMRDIVWGVDPHNNTLGDLLDQMREYVARLVPLTPYPIVVEAVGIQAARPVQTLLRQHLYAIFKEAVTNALRHAQQPTQLLITLKQHDNGILLEVYDDGQAQPASRRRGMGLRSMRERTQLLRGHLEAGPQPTAGFLVRLQVRI
jgi:signal transduction histidine kinase